MKFLHTSDWHVGRTLNGWSLLEEQEWAFQQIVDLAIREQVDGRSEEHTSELQSRVDISYAVFCLKKKNFFNDTATTEIYTLSLHDALPI